MPGQDDMNLPGIEELMNTIRGINDGSITDEDVPEDLDEPEDTPPADDNQDDNEPEDQNDEPEDDNDNLDDQDPPADDNPPATQTPEERKRFAAERRQREMQERVDAEVNRKLQEMQQNSPEIQLANQLAEIYGTTPQQMLAQLREQRLQQQAEQQKVPVEVLREQQRLKDENLTTQQEVLKLRFQMWNERTTQEGQAIKQEFGLNDEDINQAKAYLLDTLKNPDVPLKQAVLALHGDKIMQNLSKQAENEALAKASGRKKSALPPQGGKPPQSQTYSAEEEYIASQLGMKVEDYLKYK